MIIVKTKLTELPKNCYKCPYGITGRVVTYNDDYKKETREVRYQCVFSGTNMTIGKRNRFCPLEVIADD